MSFREIARFIGCSYSLIQYYIKKFKIIPRTWIVEISKGKLIRLYEKGKTQQEIAKKLGVSQTDIGYKMKKYGIKARRTGPPESLPIKLFKTEYEILNGNLLGDGGYYKHIKTNAGWSCVSKYKEYCEWLKSQLRFLKNAKIKQNKQFDVGPCPIKCFEYKWDNHV